MKEIFSRSEPLYLQVEAKLHILIYCHSMEKQNIIICRHFGQELAEALRGGYDRVFVLTDEHTHLYSQSPRYVYAFLEEELHKGKMN